MRTSRSKNFLRRGGLVSGIQVRGVMNLAQGGTLTTGWLTLNMSDDWEHWEIEEFILSSEVLNMPQSATVTCPLENISERHITTMVLTPSDQFDRTNRLARMEAVITVADSMGMTSTQTMYAEADVPNTTNQPWKQELNFLMGEDCQTLAIIGGLDTVPRRLNGSDKRRTRFHIFRLHPSSDMFEDDIDDFGLAPLYYPGWMSSNALDPGRDWDFNVDTPEHMMGVNLGGYVGVAKRDKTGGSFIEATIERLENASDSNSAQLRCTSGSNNICRTRPYTQTTGDLAVQIFSGISPAPQDVVTHTPSP